MNMSYKRIASALASVILLLLCLTPSLTVFATEKPPGGGGISIESSIEEKLPEEKPEPPEDGASMGPESIADGTYTEPVTAAPSQTVEHVSQEPDTAATAKELLAWLQEHENSEGTLVLTDDIFLDDLLYMKNSTKEITIDTGEFSIIATGEVYFWRSGLTVRGLGREKGVFQAAEGGGLSIGYMSIEAAEGFAVFQEEGAGLVITQCALEESAVHYAKTPFVWEWKTSLAVVEPGQTAADVLPDTVDAYYVNRLGQMEQEGAVPVVWDLSGHGASEEQRLRFEAAGGTPGFASFHAPVCTVVYDDSPLTFLNVTVKKSGQGQRESYFVAGSFSKPEDRLPITIAKEYSFDGETWILYMEDEINDPDTTFDISLPPGTWDVQNFPRLYIRLSWNDAGTIYYSNVLCFAADNLEKSEDKGGVRGGGTDIVDPSQPPQPDREPETAPPQEPSEPETAPPQETPEPEPIQPGNSVSDHESDKGGEGAASPPESLGGSQDDTEEPSHKITQKPDLPGGSSDNAAAPPLSVSEPAASPEPASEGVPPNEAVVSSAHVEEEAKSPSAAADTQPSHAPSASSSEPPKRPEHIPASKDETPGDTLPVITPKTPPAFDNAAAPPPSGKGPEVMAEPEKETAKPAPDGHSIAAGLAAVTVSIGGAALYLHPKARKKLSRTLRNRIKR